MKSAVDNSEKLTPMGRWSWGALGIIYRLNNSISVLTNSNRNPVFFVSHMFSLVFRACYAAGVFSYPITLKIILQ
jgi:hypothetical protein